MAVSAVRWRVPPNTFVVSKEPSHHVEGRSGPRAGRGATADKPLLMVDVDGVISLFWAPGAAAGATATAGREGTFHSIEGIPHFLSSAAAAHLLELAREFELVWATGWEERADEHLPHLLGLPAGLPHLTFGRGERGLRAASAHWKVDVIEEFAQGRPLAWIDDAIDDDCHEWALTRRAPTLLVQTRPQEGLTAREVRPLTRWARALARAR